MVKMFSNLIKVFHDGIIITEEQDILYKNKVINKILETDSLKSDSVDSNVKGLNHLDAKINTMNKS
jgi:hypothetical protein